MRKLIILILCLTSLNGFSQFIVEDPALVSLMGTLNTQVTTNQVQNSAEFASQTATLAQTLEFMKETRETLKKVNATLTEILYYKDLIKTQLKIIEYQIRYIKEIRADKNITLKEAEAVGKIMSDLLTKSEGLLKFSKSLLSDNTYSMTDAERMEQLKAVNDEMTACLSEMVGIEQKFNAIRKDRALANILENW